MAQLCDAARQVKAGPGAAAGGTEPQFVVESDERSRCARIRQRQHTRHAVRPFVGTLWRSIPYFIRSPILITRYRPLSVRERSCLTIYLGLLALTSDQSAMKPQQAQEHQIVTRAGRSNAAEQDLRVVTLSVAFLRRHFYSPLSVAAQKIGISLTALKRWL